MHFEAAAQQRLGYAHAHCAEADHTHTFHLF
jgi:hypothetical protein